MSRVKCRTSCQMFHVDPRTILYFILHCRCSGFTITILHHRVVNDSQFRLASFQDASRRLGKHVTILLPVPSFDYRSALYDADISILRWQMSRMRLDFHVVYADRRLLIAFACRRASCSIGRCGRQCRYWRPMALANWRALARWLPRRVILDVINSMTSS